jgi:serine/threonine-protein kinase HipA
MNREITVYIDQRGGEPSICGRLWTRTGARENSSFEYDLSWFAQKNAFEIDPELPLRRGSFHTQRPLFRAFMDPAPDRWGQTLLRRAERARARNEGRAPRSLTAVDFLTLVDDQTRLGALRFKDRESGESFLSAERKPIPPLLDLPRLLAATTRIVNDDETDEDLALLLAPGTSLGGARPKASVRGTKGELMIAKFPREDDEWPVTVWEAVTLSLAKASGIRVPEFSVKSISDKPVLILSRFDRVGLSRVPFMSAMTALAADDRDTHSYLELAEALRRGGSHVKEDLRELWRRLAFNVLVSNTDDHLRNHAFLRDEAGWRLAPAYDLNPTPVDVKPRIHALAIDESDTRSSMETAFTVAPNFGLSLAEARAISREVGGVVRTWRRAAEDFGLSRHDTLRMESAFEHEDLTNVTS